MTKLKIVDTILLAISALIMVAKSIVKFIGYVGKLKSAPATGTL